MSRLTPEREKEIREGFDAMAVDADIPSWTRDLLAGIDALRPPR